MKGPGVHVREHRLRAHVADRFRGGEETVGGNDDFVTWADASGLESQLQSRRSGAHRNRVFGAYEPSKFFLKLLDPFSAHEVAGFEDRVHALAHLLLDRRVLRLQVKKGDSYSDRRNTQSSHHGSSTSKGATKFCVVGHQAFGSEPK